RSVNLTHPGASTQTPCLLQVILQTDLGAPSTACSRKPHFLTPLVPLTLTSSGAPPSTSHPTKRQNALLSWRHARCRLRHSTSPRQAAWTRRFDFSKRLIHTVTASSSQRSLRVPRLNGARSWMPHCALMLSAI